MDLIKADPGLRATTSGSNRAFGVVFSVVFGAIGLWPLMEGTEPRWWCIAVAGAILVLALIWPGMLSAPNRAWQRFGNLLHKIISPIVLAAVFFVIVTPIGLLRRLIAGDQLGLRWHGGVSYWQETDTMERPVESLRKQF